MADTPLTLRLPLQHDVSDYGVFLYLEIPEAARAALGIEKPTRVIGSVNGVPFDLMVQKWHALWFLYISKTTASKLGAQVGDWVDLVIARDPDPTRVSQPIELQVLLDAEPLAAERLLALTPGAQRSLAFTVSRPKREETRIQKALAILNHLLEGTIEDYLRQGRGGTRGR